VCDGRENNNVVVREDLLPPLVHTIDNNRLLFSQRRAHDVVVRANVRLLRLRLDDFLSNLSRRSERGGRTNIMVRIYIHTRYGLGPHCTGQAARKYGKYYSTTR
jgi:hypothetical protein